jgi:DNA-binding SARP family transcriptional activator/tetratricopeptide (TPR) repeat protein
MADGRSGVELRLLGPLELRLDGRPVALGGRRPRAILADLAVHLGEVVSVDRLSDDVWGEQAPATAPHAVEVHVSRLRKAFGDARDLLETRPPGYRLLLDPERVDAHHFEKLVAAAREAEAHAAAESAREALALWRGPPLADFAYEPFAQLEIARLEGLREQCLSTRIDADLAVGRHEALVAELESLVALEPLRERLRVQLMLALYRSGRQADALAVFRAARETLVETLGVEPGPELRSLESAILNHDPSLLAPTPPKHATTRRRLAAIVAARVDLTALASSLDAEAFHDLLDEYVEAVTDAVARHGGSVESFAGESVTAVFGVPVSHEDDALRAAQAALDVRAGVEALAARTGAPLELRVGIECGEVVAGRRRVTGEPVDLATRLRDAAAAGTIAIGARAERLLAHAAVLDGNADAAGSRLVEVATGALAIERRFDGPLVGRTDELAQLRAALAGAIAERKTSGILVFGPAGIGKSRLVEELVRGANAQVLAGRCLPYGDGITYWPLRTIVPDDELTAILAAPSADEIALAFRRWCEELAEEEPVLLVLDDLHWAEPTFLSLVGQLVGRGEGPMLVVGLAREELVEERPDFIEGTRLEVGPLGPGDAEALAGALLGRTPPERLVAAAEGNPLFLEQLLADDSVVGATQPLPGSIRALLAARLERLGPGERAVIERAAVAGKEFEAEDVVALLEPAAAGTATRHLQALVERGFVRTPARGAFAFRHGLIQETVYRSTAKQERADLHERFADRLGRVEELDELVGYHLEQAYRLRTELGDAGRAVRQLAADAGARLGAAGMRAWKRNDVPATVSLLERSTDLRVDAALLCELGVAQWTGGNRERALATLERVRIADRGSALRAEIEATAIRMLGGEVSADDLRTLIARAIPTLETLGDDRTLGRAWLFAGFVDGGIHGRYVAWEEAAERALSYYRRAAVTPATCMQQLAVALFYGPAPVPRAMSRCEQLLENDEGGLIGRANVTVCLAGLHAMLGQFEQARALVATASRIFDDLGQPSTVATHAESMGGEVELLADDPAAAERRLRASCAALRELGDDNTLATRAARLAEALYRQERLDESDEWASLSEARATVDDVSAQPLWRGVRAKLLARGGEHAEAEACARDAVEIVAATEALDRHACLLLDLAEVMRLTRRPRESRAAIEAAVPLFERKGNAVGTSRARSLLAQPVLT